MSPIFMRRLHKTLKMEWLLNREFSVKCLVASGLAVMGYVLLPKRSSSVAVLLTLGSTIGLAWFDAAYSCSDKLRSQGGLSNAFAVTGPFKPALRAGV